MAFTRFQDNESGGERKLEFRCVWIEATEMTARQIFKERFGRPADHVTCPCPNCGPDFRVSEHQTLDEATKLDRGGNTVGHFFDKNRDVMLLRAN